MIALIAGFAMQSPGVLEWLDPSWNAVSIQAVVKLPPLDSRDRSLLRQVVGTLGSETVSFSGNQMADLAARAGSRIRATMMEDQIRIGMEVVPADMSTGISMIGSILREPVVVNEKLDFVGQDLQFRRSNYWRQSLERYPFQPEKYAARDVSELIERVLRPENVWLAVGGKVTPGLATRRWEEIVGAWTMRKQNSPKTEPNIGRFAEKLDADVSVIDFQAEAFSGSDAALATRLLALTALGTGKAASLWRVSRETLGVSYRQEAVLYPVQGGFQPRLLIAHSGTEPLEELAAKIKEGLLADIAAWTDGDRKRALGMAQSYLVRGGDLSPLYFAPGRPIDSDLADQTFLQAYWLMKTGSRWNPHSLVGRMGFVELDDLKATAQKMVSGAHILIHKGKE